MTDIQSIIIKIYKEVAGILNKNNIDYYANGGTCLGAVRHGGFIPWDDDIDITIKIEDYEKAKEVLSKELPSYYTIRHYDNNKYYANLFFKVVDERTTCIEKIDYNHRDAFKGCFIDVMPISGMPNNIIRRKLFCIKINIYRKLSEMRIYGDDVLASGWKKKIYHVMKVIIEKKPSNYYCKKWFELINKYPFYKCRYTGYVWWYDVMRLTYRKEVFGTPTPMKFEDTVMYCPEKWDDLLKQQFGNYMTLPPIDSQRPMHSGTIDLKHSYHDYIEGKYPLAVEGDA